MKRTHATAALSLLTAIAMTNGNAAGVRYNFETLPPHTSIEDPTSDPVFLTGSIVFDRDVWALGQSRRGEVTEHITEAVPCESELDAAVARRRFA